MYNNWSYKTRVFDTKIQSNSIFYFLVNKLPRLFFPCAVDVVQMCKKKIQYKWTRPSITQHCNWRLGSEFSIISLKLIRPSVRPFVHLSLCLSENCLPWLMSFEVLIIEHWYLACTLLVTSPLNLHHAVTLTSNFDLLKGKKYWRTGIHYYREHRNHVAEIIETKNSDLAILIFSHSQQLFQRFIKRKNF